MDLERVRDDVISLTQDPHLTDDPVDSVAHTDGHPYLRLHRLGLLSLKLKDTASVEALADQLHEESRAGPARTTGRVLATSLRAHLAAARGRTREAMGLFEEVTGGRVGTTTSLEPYDRLLYAQLLEERGRRDEALGYYSQLGTHSPFELALVWQAELGIARIHEKRGERALAAHYYHRVASRLKHADPALLPARDDALRKAAALLPLDSGRRLR
jgi:tetratricopeptide (TPR) repeat protein